MFHQPSTTSDCTMADTAVAPPPTTSSPNTQSTTLQRTRANLAFLANPSTAPAPASRSTRAFLRTARYTLKFIFWRLVRYAKYAAIGSLTALVAGSAIGSVASGAAFFIAPTGILGGAAVGLMWGLGKFGWRRLAKKAGKGTGDARRDERDDAQGERIREVQERREEQGLKSDPW
jgi:hypothetical protein